jgi:mono/diheme cytochrome c family protein
VKSVLLLAGLGSVCFAQSSSSSDFFEAKVRPVFLARCSFCHGDKVQMGQKQFTSADTMHRSGAIVPGDPEASPLIQAVRYGGKAKMPPSGKLPQPEIDALEKWVREGAVWPAETAMVKKPAASSYWRSIR